MVRVYVYSAQDNLPLKNVQIILYINDKSIDTTFTDKEGYFTQEKLVGCVPNCPNGKLVFMKNGFNNIVIEINEDFYKVMIRTV